MRSLNRKDLRAPIIASLLLFFCARVILTARAKSATFDEAYNISFGVAVLRDESFLFRQNKPIFSMCLQALPQLLTGALPPRGPAQIVTCLRFLYHNTVDSDRILFRSRMASLGAAVLLGFLVYAAGGLWALAFYTFSPNILAHAGLATEDIVLTTLYFASIYSFLGLMKRPTRAQGAFFGLATACALMSKYTGLLLFPTLALLWLISRRRLPLKTGLAALAAFCLAFLSVYGPTHLIEYWRGLAVNNQAMLSGHATFFWGHYGRRGFLLYFLGAVLLKSTVPLLVLSSIPFFRLGNLREGECPFWTLPVAVLLIIASFSPSQNGLRYVLPIYPFLCVLASKQMDFLPRPLSLFLAAWHGLASLYIHPHYLAYFNELAGGPSKGWHYLVESNMDWGQDLKGLQAYVKENKVSDVVLSYYGCVLPEAIGFPFQDLYSIEIWGEKGHLNSRLPKKELLAISVTNLQGMYLVPAFGYNPMAWIKDLEPEAVIGHTIYLYDITKTARAHEWLAHTYLVAGFPRAARHEIERALAIDPASSWATLLSAFLAPNPNEGLRNFEKVNLADCAEKIPWHQILVAARPKAWYERGLGTIEKESARRGRRRLAHTARDLSARLGLNAY